MGRYASPYPGSKRPRAGRALGALTIVGLLGLAYLLYRGYLGGLNKSQIPAKGIPTGGDGSELLRQQVEQPGVPAKLAGIAQKPRPPGWPFDPLDYPKPKTFFDITIDGKPAGRITFELFTKQAPRAAENFRALCTGEKGRAKVSDVGDGPRLHYKGARFYRVIDQFICQTGIETPSIYGGEFDDDPGALDLKHNKKGLLSAANIGPNTTTTHFSIVVAPAPHLNGHYPIFGQVVGGMDVVDRINALAKPTGSKDESPKLPVVVSNCGELICDEANTCKEITLQER